MMKRQPLPPGIHGELWLGGDGVARGYWGDAELTGERFAELPGIPGRLYRSGDLVCLRDDGNIEFHGRIDRQVKLRGFRIELGEIEVELTRCPGVRQCAVVVQGTGTAKRLVAFVVPEEAGAGAANLRDALTGRLPNLHDSVGVRDGPCTSVQERESRPEGFVEIERRDSGRVVQPPVRST